MADRREKKIAELLQEAAETHHRVYRITDGSDDDWASWYAQWLLDLSELYEHHSELAQGAQLEVHVARLACQFESLIQEETGRSWLGAVSRFADPQPAQRRPGIYAFQRARGPRKPALGSSDVPHRRGLYETEPDGGLGRPEHIALPLVGGKRTLAQPQAL